MSRSNDPTIKHVMAYLTPVERQSIKEQSVRRKMSFSDYIVFAHNRLVNHGKKSK